MRLLAAATVTLVIVAVTAIADGDALVPFAVGAGLIVAGWWLHRRSEGPSAAATSSLVVALVLVVLGFRNLLVPLDDQLETFLIAAGTGFVVLGGLLDERRLVSLGLLQWVAALLRPDPDAAPFRHCLIATDLAIPVPQLDGVLVLGLAAVVAGSLARILGWRLEAARGAEVTGLVTLNVGLLAKAVELPDLAILCGGGRGIDPGWLILAMLVGVASALYGAAGRDPVWTGVGGGALALGGLLGTVLSGEVRWSLFALLPLVAALGLVERAGVPWPRQPGYGRRRPWRPS